MNRPAKLAAFTFVELLICISIVAILAMFAAPGFRFFQEEENIVAAAELLSDDLHWARSEAIKRGLNVRVLFTTLNAAEWQYQIDTQESTPEVLKTVTRAAYPEFAGITLSQNFSSNDTIFEPIRGDTIGHAGTATLTSAKGNYQLEVRVGNLLRVRICPVGGAFGGYKVCI